MAEKRTIVVTVKRGLVQGIDGIPADVRILVRDYDVESANLEDLVKDEVGELCAEAIWEGDDALPDAT